MLAFSPPLRLTLLIAYVAAIFAAPATSIAPSLTVRTSTSSINVDRLENLKVTTTIVNTGDDTLKLLNDPRGVLDPSPENAFTITGPSGSRSSFSGGSVNHDSKHVANLNHPGPFTVLAPGASINITHDLPAAYSFAQSGAGDYSIEPSNLFTYVDADGTPKDLYATVEGIAKVKLSGNLVASRHVHDKRVRWNPRSKKKPKFKNCSDEQQRSIEAAAVEVQKDLPKANTELKETRTDPHRGLYTRWFGTYTKKNGDTVQATLKRMKRNISFSRYTYDCQCDEEFPAQIIAHLKRIRICKPFWDLGEAAKSGQLIRMAGRLDLRTITRTYGMVGAHQLAKTDPANAILNLDNYIAFIQRMSHTDIPGSSVNWGPPRTDETQPPGKWPKWEG